MDSFDGKGAVVTGGASGIGLATARLLGTRGARLVLADIEQAALDSAVEGLRGEGIDARGIVCDVRSLDAVQSLAAESFAQLGGVHLVFNNAGVAVGGPIVEMTHDDWRWVIDVDLWGPIHGVEAFVPRMVEQGEGGHVLFTASFAGLVPNIGLGPYCVAKYGVVALAEVLARELRDHEIGVSVLCPMRVGTNIGRSERNRSEEYGGAEVSPPVLDQGDGNERLTGRVLPVDEVAARTVEAVVANRLYVLPHDESRPPIQRRFERIDRTFAGAGGTGLIVVGDLHGGDEELALRLGQQAFGGTDPFDPDRPGVGEGRHVAAYLDGALVGQVRRLAFGQWFGGRRLACAGISSVTVVPQARGRSLARRMLTESIERAAADGEVVAALFPTTAALYRSVGFEVAGWWIQQGIPMGELPRDDGSLAWERADIDDPRALAVYDRMAPDFDGWLDPGLQFWTLRAMQARKDTKVNRYSYVGLRGAEPVASLQYAYGPSDRAMYRLDVEGIYGTDGAAVRAALAFLGTNGTTADEVRTLLPADELELHLTHAQRMTVRRTWPWMLALVDLPGAIAGRGYPPGVSGSVPLAVADPRRPANHGSWVLTVEDGKAALEPGGDGRVEVGITDLAAVFTGHLDPLRLARDGRLGHPTPADIGLLRAAFAGQPSLTIFF